ncbi:hypothetical protein [Magnetovibrio blakemorei]|uniref:Uncharacterized protein n=1 Tax=Magnetovibrio blakemorei TaxID=28181 RepID=A0A1E5Q427_9PROT|nr:hypothetical protein [Magnetovibrio blakemorei]OEJ64570.1 hypothetical protein BEN30_16205 [Magnetovibrio blakemorei]
MSKKTANVKSKPENSASTVFFNLVKTAQTAVITFDQGVMKRLAANNAELYEALAAIYGVYVAGKTYPDDHNQFLIDHNVVPSKRAKTDAHSTVKAFYPEGKRHDLRQRINYDSQAMAVLEHNKVVHEDAADWLATPLRSGEVGLAKVKVMYAKLPEVKKRREKAAEAAKKRGTSHQQRAVDAVTEFLKKAEKYGAARANPDLASMAGQRVLLIGVIDEQGRTELRVLTDDENKVSDITLTVVEGGKLAWAA